MKRQLLILLCFVLAGTSYAEFRSAEEALLIANSSNVSQKMGAKQKNVHPYRLVGVRNQLDNATPAFYVLQRDTNDGFMLISAETQSETIIGYCETGSFDLENAPSNVKIWMNRYARQISALAQSSGVQPRKMATSYTPISPIIGTTWGQGSPYNQNCPKVNSTSTVTGCVATAISQIMFYHKYPTKGTGSHSYTWNSQTLSANFANTTYDWKNMLKKYTSSATTAQKNAVATLIYHVGVASNMNYGTASSGANTNAAVKSLLTYFDYDPAIDVCKLDYSGEDNTQASIVYELQNGRPVLFSARTVNNEGHAFVCEGLDAKGYLYINWGWNGYQDGYFALTLLDPKDQGTGGSASDEAFTEDVTVFTGIQPNQGGVSVPYVTASQSVLYSNERIAKKTTTGFTLTKVTNSGVADWNPVLYLVVMNPADNSVVTYKTKTVSTSALAPGYYYTVGISVTGSFSNLSAGEYNIGVYTIDSKSTIHPVDVMNVGQMIVPITVTQDSIFFHLEEEEPVEDPDYSHLKMINAYGTNQWQMDLTSPLFWSSSSLQNDRLVRCNIVSGSSNSTVGSYVLSTSGEEGTIASDAMFAYGYSSSCYQYTPLQMQFTFTAEDEKIVVDYYYEYSTKKEVGKVVIDEEEQDWWQSYSGNYYYHESPTKEVATPMSVASAKTIGNACTDSTYIPFLIKGFLSTDPTLSKGKLYFSISDDGTSYNALKVNKCLWLDQSNATSSCGLRKGDQVIIYSKITNSSSTLSCQNGYVYEHTPNSVTGLNENNLLVNTSSKILMDGQVKIVREGRIYNLLGTPLD